MATSTVEPRFLSPPDIAKLLGVGNHKVLAWIVRGELRAADLSEARRQRPRYRVSREDLESFLARRAATPPPKLQRRRRKRDDDVM